MYRLTVLATLTLLNACGKQQPTEDPCAGAICTEEFRMFSVHLIDKNGQKTQFQNYYVVNVAGNDTIQGQPLGYDSSYVVLDDSYQSKIANKTVDFYLYGTTVKGSRVKAEKYSFSADCCHISKVSGADTIKID